MLRPFYRDCYHTEVNRLITPISAFHCTPKNNKLNKLPARSKTFLAAAIDMQSVDYQSKTALMPFSQMFSLVSEASPNSTNCFPFKPDGQKRFDLINEGCGALLGFYINKF